MPLQATSGAASYDAFGGGVAAVPQYIEEVFGTFLYTGNSSTQTINNGIDLAGKGGLVWVKWRNGLVGSGSHVLVDTSRGVNKFISSNSTAAEATQDTVSAFNANGFNLTGDGGGKTNYSGDNYVSWTFRKQPKFFDVVTYTGNGNTSSRNISHNLGSLPGFMIVKAIGAPTNWMIAAGDSSGNYNQLSFNADISYASTPKANLATTTTFDIGYWNGNFDGAANINGVTYVAYLFAHNAGGFGLTGTDNVISCGSFSQPDGNNVTVNLGYEPQLVMLKRTDAAGSWVIADNMRGMAVSDATTGSGNAVTALRPNSSSEEQVGYAYISPTATGFVANIANPATFIYITIRRGPMKVPTSGTSVFAPVAYTEILSTQTLTTGFPVDLIFQAIRNDAQGFYWSDRLRGSTQTANNYLTSFNTSAEINFGITPLLYDNSTGVTITNNGAFNNTPGRTNIVECLRRAPGFFDEVCYTGTGANTTVAHNLAAVPELMIVKSRSGATQWRVYNAGIGAGNVLFLSFTDPSTAGSNVWNSTAPTSSVFSLGTNSNVNTSGATYVAYLFASCPGVSKVGSYTGDGTNYKDINCGFTSGARFVMIKRTDAAGDWYVFDTARGITTGSDKILRLNSTAAEITSDEINPLSTGFSIGNNNYPGNVSGGTYIFLAIA